MGRTPLIVAANHGYKRIVRVLLPASATNIDAVENEEGI